MKKLTNLALLLAMTGLSAAPVDQNTAVTAARNWFAAKSGRAINAVESVYERKQQNSNTLYTVTFKDGGFVIIAGDDQITPVLAYSPTSPATANTADNPALDEWINNYSYAVVAVRDKKISNAKVAEEWKNLLNNDLQDYRDTKAVEPLVKALFDQGSPYDMYTPNNWPVGCVATAMSMLMSYYHWPHVGNGTKTYTDTGSGQTLTANFGTTTYDWSRILNVNTGASPQGAKEMVATLSLHAGIGANMTYGQSGSSSNISKALTAFKSYFRMKSTANIKYRDSYTDANWKTMVKNELNANRPLYYRGNDSEGAGHAFVLDGFLTNATTDRFHFNWGWNGSYNGYFLIDSLVPSGTGTGGGSGDYSLSNAAIFDLWDYNSVPSQLSGLELYDKGNGTELFVKWNRSHAANLKNYRIRVGTTSYKYDNSFTTNDTTITLSDLTSGTKYYVGITQLDQEDDESPVIEKSCTPNLNPVPPTNLTAEPQWQKIKVTWNRNSELDLSGYNLYKSINGIDYFIVNSELITDTSYIEQEPSHENYTYYKVKAVDTQDNLSSFSAAVSARPVTLNQGVLILDESINGTGTPVSPNDEQQDQFYNDATANIVHKSNFDANAAGKVTLSELGPYSSIIWHNNAVELGSMFYNNKSDVKKYLDFGGKILLLADKPGKLIENSNSYPINFDSNSLIESYFGIDSSYYKAAARCSGATPFSNGYSYLTVDTAKALLANGEHIKKLETLRAAPEASVIYKYDSGYDITNNWGTEKGKPLGVEKITTGYKTVTIAMPLYFVKETEAQKLIDYVMSTKFGEQVGINNEASGKINSLSLFGNYPNPFNPSTAISFFNPVNSDVTVTVFNAKGETAAQISKYNMAAGRQTVNFNGASLNSGVYFYRISSGKENVTGKMLLVK